MEYYDINLNCIKSFRYSMYKSIINLDNTSIYNSLEGIETIKARNGELVLKIRYQLKDYRLNSLYNPTEEANRWVEQYSFNSINNVIAMFGLGNGIFARTIVNKMNKGDTLIIYEPCAELFMYVLHKYNLTDLLENPNVIIAIKDINEFDFHNMLQSKTNVTNIKNVIKCIYPNYDNIFTESCIQFWQEIKDAYNHQIIQINTMIAFGRVYIENTIKNLKYLPKTLSIFELREILPKDIPAIVVAAGPSVANQIEDLRKVKGKALIIAVDRILDYLLDSGVIPDFVFTLDPIKPVEYFTKRKKVTIPLLTFMVSNNEIFEIHEGKKIICNCSDFLQDYYININKIPPKIIASSSVATAAFTACVELGFKNIILVGQDLAYKGNVTHAGGIEEKIDLNNEIMTEGVNGEIVRTRYDWKVFLKWYEDFLTIYPSINVIDTKDSGAKIKGTKLMSLEQAIKKYSNVESQFVITDESLMSTFSDDDINKLRDYLQDSLTQLEEIKVMTEEALEICDKLIIDNEINLASRSIDKNLKKLKRINSFIVEQQIYELMDPYVTAVSAQKLADAYQFSDDLKEDSFNTYIRAKAIFEGMIEAANIIQPLLNDAIKII